MMKSCVIFTLQGANNIGAFLQAYGLMTVLKRLEIDVKFGIYPNDKTEKSNLLAKVIRYIKTGDIKKLMYKVKTVSTYREIQSTLPTIDMYSNPFFDYAIIGSDEVWNIKSDNFVHYPSFLGHDINADKIVAYAACGNGVTTGDFARLLPCEDFSAFTSLSARDYDTVKCVEQVSKRTVMRVVDPTMLIDDFDIDIPQCPISNDFILVYSYGIDKKHIKGIKTFAKKNKLPLISVGTYNSWCDKNVVANPWEFLGYLRAAKYVIVSTFHGTVLSVKFNKQFVCFAGNSSKVRDILSFYDLMDRNVQGLENVDTLFKSTIDYTTANEIIKQSRNLSMNYLREALGL